MQEEIITMLRERTAQILSKKQESPKASRPEPSMRQEAVVLVNAFKSIDSNFDINKADRNVMNSLLAWVWEKDSLNMLHLDYSKGLFLFGEIGRGKSLALHALRRYMCSVCNRFKWKRNDVRMKAWGSSASEMANEFASDGLAKIKDYAKSEINLVIDELGREPIPAKYFGTEMNVMQFVLQLRYDSRKQNVTHVTTNLKLEDIGKIYGNYVADRCLEMFNFIEFKGESLRS